jgi:hypothetical protein
MGTWVAATVLAAVVAWSAVARLGQVDSGATTPLTQSQVSRDLAQQGSASTPPPSDTSGGATVTAPPPGHSTTQPPATTTTPPATSPPTHPGTAPPSGGSSQTSSNPPSAPLRSRSWTLNGGDVGAACRGDVLSLGHYYAYPRDGWSVKSEVDPREITVEFERGDAKSKLRIVCQAGIPTGERDDGGYGGGGDGGGDGDGDGGDG